MLQLAAKHGAPFDVFKRLLELDDQLINEPGFIHLVPLQILLEVGTSNAVKCAQELIDRGASFQVLKPDF